jgi:hypothetical protein
MQGFVDGDPKGVGGSFAQPQHGERDGEAGFDISRWSWARSTPSAISVGIGCARFKVHHFLHHTDTVQAEDDPSAIKMVVSSDCSGASGHSACGVIDQHSASCI